MAEPVAFEASLRAARRRLRLQRMLAALGWSGAVALTLLGPGSLRLRVAGGSDAVGVALCCLAAVLPWLVMALTGARRISMLSVAQLLDRSLGLPNAIASAWAFQCLPVEQRGRFMASTLSRAEQTLRDVDLAQHMRWRMPSVFWSWPLLVLGVLCVAQFPVRSVPQPLAAGRALPGAPAEIPGVEAVARALARSELRPEDRALAAELARLLGRVQRRELDQVQWLRALDQIDQRAASTLHVLAEQQADLRKLGRSLTSQPAARGVGAALASGDLSLAQLAFQRLAKRAEAGGGERDVERFRAALRAARARREADARARAQEPQQPRSPSAGPSRKRSLDALERERPEPETPSASDARQPPAANAPQAPEARGRDESGVTAPDRDARSAIPSSRAEDRPDGREREHSGDLDPAARSGDERDTRRRLDSRERDPRDTAADGELAGDRDARGESGDPRRALDDFERELERASGNDAARKPADDLRRASDALEPLKQMQGREAALRRLSERVAELRQLRSDPRADDSPSRVRAEADTNSAPLTVGELRRMAATNAGEQPPRPGADHSRTAAADLDAPSATGAPRVTGSSAQEHESSQPAKSSDASRSTSGKPTTGVASALQHGGVEQAVAGISGPGPSRSAVIYDSAARGFSAPAYRRVHADYRGHAEAELEHESRPAAQRARIRRYFQLIGPPEETP